MSLLLGLFAAAAAQTCPDISAVLSEAWALFEDAELEDAAARVAEADRALLCQSEPLVRDALLELYRLDALIALAQEDRKGATYATIRTVGIAGAEGAPPERYGPELAELYATWAERLAPTQISVGVVGTGSVWVDGMRADATEALQVIAGEHVVQVEQPDGSLVAERRELSADIVLEAGDPPAEVPEEPVAPPALVEEPAPVEAVATVPSRRRPAPLWAAGGALGAGGAVVLVVASAREASFHEHPFSITEREGCERGTACYADTRDEVVRAFARDVNTLYGIGYGLAGVGVGLLGTAVIGLPVRTDGRSLRVDLVF